MKWASAVSGEVDMSDAAAEAAAIVKAHLDSATPDLAVIFLSEHHRSGYDDFAMIVEGLLGPAHVIGCSAGGVIGGGREIEERPGLSITAAVLPDVRIEPFHLEHENIPDLDSSPRLWTERVGIAADIDPQFLLFADPFSFDVESFLKGMDFAYPAGTKVGGLASGARSPGGNALYLDGDLWNSGLVGVAMSGNLRIDTIVAQGCRPIGAPLFITKCRENVLFEVDGRPVLEALHELYNSLSEKDQALFRNSLFLGIVMNEFQQEYRQGDYLIRNLVGMDRESGAVAVGALLKERQVVQFHLRDAATSSEDLDLMLKQFSGEGASQAACGSLLFSCLGRGMNLYGESDHDTKAFRRHLGDIPLGGFFCNGEVGPVHGETYVHGYTSSFGIFRPRSGF